MANIQNGDLQEEMIEEILTRGHVRDLMRFNCVCQSWNARSTNPHFIAKQLAWATSHNHHRGAIFKGWGWVPVGGSVKTLQPRVYALSNETLELSRNVDLRQLFRDEVDLLEVVGTCSGILCFAGSTDGFDYDQLVLWNPATRESKMLPPIDMPTSTCASTFGFGIDPRTNDYKVVGIKSIDSHCKVVVVYSLSTNSWRVIDSSPSPSYWIEPPLHPSYLNGDHYWWANDEDGNRFLISFDMSNEVFQEVPRPPDVGVVYGDIAVINDSLTLIVPDVSNGKKWFEVWVLNESGVEWTWTKKFTLEGICRGWNLEQLREDGLVVLRTGENALVLTVLYDSETQELRDTGIRESEPDMQLVTYTETLVSLNGPENAVEQHDN